MGYTNYLEVHAATETIYDDFLSDAMRLLNELDIKPYASFAEADEALKQKGKLSEICGYRIDDGELILYGPHESCLFPKGGGSEFCKTNHKSYDPLVKLLMCLAVKHMGGEVSADEGKPHRENFMWEFWAQGGDNIVLVRWAEAINMEQYVQE